MPAVTNVRCTSLDLDRLVISWDYSESEASLLDFDLYVERGESPAGPFVTLTQRPLVDRTLFVDIQKGLLHYWTKMYYRIRVVQRATGVTTYCPDLPVTLRARPPLDALEMSRQELVLLKEFTGRKCWLFKRRTTGPHCPECWDRFSAQRTKSSCLSCWGTGRMGGYHRPIEFYCQIDPVGESPQLNEPLGEQRQMLSTGRTIFFPPVDSKDVIVEAENNRWRVGSVTRTERARAPVKQEMQLFRIPEGDVEYRLPVDVDPVTLEPTGIRQFSNPTVPGNVGGVLDSMFSVLGVDE